MAGTVYQKNRTSTNWDSYLKKAERVYKQLIAMEPDNFDANYNLGVLYYNEAVDIVNKNDIDTDIDELTKVLEFSTELFKKALPYLLNIYDSQEPNLKLVTALQAIYYNLNLKDELNEINAVLKGLNKS
jgi:tetratricopeptide (TPR) repeat protein